MKPLFALFAVALASTTSLILTTPKAAAGQVKLEAELSQSVLTTNQAQRIYLRINLEGIPLKSDVERPPVNVAIVIDRSGSMRGDKLARAKEAAIMAVHLMRPDDIVSVVSYSDKVEVVVPATRLSQKAEFIAAIEGVKSQGMTALYAGVRKGGSELKKFLERNQVSRVILLSDGLANVGPRTPEELATLGRELGHQGISVTTIGLGLGYNEDLMTKLAYNSDGNHAFVEKASQLVKVFRAEFGDVLSVVATQIEVTITCKIGVKPIRIFGRKAQINGQKITFPLNQIYGAQQKYVVAELSVPAFQMGEQQQRPKLDIVTVEARYNALGSKTPEHVTAEVIAQISASKEEAEGSVNKTVMTGVINQIAIERNEKAVKLRDKGKTKEAVQALQANATYLRREAKRLGSKKLQALASDNAKDAKNMARPSGWNKTRKAMKYKQYRGKNQQIY